MTVFTDKHRIAFEIDDADLCAVSHYSWFIGGDGYPSTNIRASKTQRPGGQKTLVSGLNSSIEVKIGD